jgi:hypothetical protein
MAQWFPRGFLNNNPGNIPHGADSLPGQRIIQTDHAFLQFATASDGIRAVALILRSYKTRGIDRLDSLIAQWSRDRCRDVEPSVAAEASALGGAPSDRIDLDDQATLFGLVKALLRRELGDDYYTDREIAEGVTRAFDLV